MFNFAHLTDRGEKRQRWFRTSKKKRMITTCFQVIDHPLRIVVFS